MQIKLTQKTLPVIRIEEHKADEVKKTHPLNSRTVDSFESFANSKQAELTEDLAKFKKTEADAEAKYKEEIHNAIKDALSDAGSSGIIGGDNFTGMHVDLPGDHTGSPSQTPDETQKKEPLPTADINQKQKELTNLLNSNRMKATSSVRDEQIRNLKNESESSLIEPRQINPSFGNPKQVEFTEDVAKFQKRQSALSASDDFLPSLSEFGDPLSDLLNGLPDIVSETSKRDQPVSETNQKQKLLTEAFTSTKSKLED